MGLRRCREEAVDGGRGCVRLLYCTYELFQNKFRVSPGHPGLEIRKKLVRVMDDFYEDLRSGINVGQPMKNSVGACRST